MVVPGCMMTLCGQFFWIWTNLLEAAQFCTFFRKFVCRWGDLDCVLIGKTATNCDHKFRSHAPRDLLLHVTFKEENNHEVAHFGSRWIHRSEPR